MLLYAVPPVVDAPPYAVPLGLVLTWSKGVPEITGRLVYWSQLSARLRA